MVNVLRPYVHINFTQFPHFFSLQITQTEYVLNDDHCSFNSTKTYNLNIVFISAVFFLNIYFPSKVFNKKVRKERIYWTETESKKFVYCCDILVVCYFESNFIGNSDRLLGQINSTKQKTMLFFIPSLSFMCSTSIY